MAAAYATSSRIHYFLYYFAHDMYDAGYNSVPIGADGLVGQQLTILAEVHWLVGPVHAYSFCLCMPLTTRK